MSTEIRRQITSVKWIPAGLRTHSTNQSGELWDWFRADSKGWGMGARGFQEEVGQENRGGIPAVCGWGREAEKNRLRGKRRKK